MLILSPASIGLLGVATGITEEVATRRLSKYQFSQFNRFGKINAAFVPKSKGIYDKGRIVARMVLPYTPGRTFLNSVRTGASTLGNFVTGVSVALDTYAVHSGSITENRYLYRTAFNVGGYLAGSLSSGGVGALVIGAGMAGEWAYDATVDWYNNWWLPHTSYLMPTGGHFYGGKFY